MGLVDVMMGRMPAKAKAAMHARAQGEGGGGEGGGEEPSEWDEF